MNVKDTKYFRSIKLESLTKDEYDLIKASGMMYEFYPEACGIYKEDVLNKRIDIIGHNGNDGSHYKNDGSHNVNVNEDNPDGISWPHRYEQGYAEKIESIYNTNKTEYTPPKDGMFSGQYVPSDPNRPNHYHLGDTGVEAIDVIETVLTKEEYIGYLRGNILKYHLRANKKNGTEDLNKADVYSGWLVEALEE